MHWKFGVQNNFVQSIRHQMTQNNPISRYSFNQQSVSLLCLHDMSFHDSIRFLIFEFLTQTDQFHQPTPVQWNKYHSAASH